MLFFVLAILIHPVTAFPPTGDGTCYYIDGSIDRFSSACYYLNTVGASMCCQSDEGCLTAGLCTGAPNGPVGPNDENKAIWRRSCSDYTWQDGACLAIAPYVVTSGAQLSKCTDGTYCPRDKSMVNTTCCDNKLGVIADSSDDPIAPSLVSRIRSSGSATSETILTSSDSARSTAATTVSPSSSLPTTTTSPPSTTSTAAAGGFSTDQKIALGAGIGIGLPTLIIAFITFLIKCLERNKPSLQTS